MPMSRTLERTVMATVGRRQAATVVSNDVIRMIHFPEYEVSLLLTSSPEALDVVEPPDDSDGVFSTLVGSPGSDRELLSFFCRFWSPSTDEFMSPGMVGFPQRLQTKSYSGMKLCLTHTVKPSLVRPIRGTLRFSWTSFRISFRCLLGATKNPLKNSQSSCRNFFGSITTRASPHVLAPAPKRCALCSFLLYICLTTFPRVVMLQLSASGSADIFESWRSAASFYSLELANVFSGAIGHHLLYFSSTSRIWTISSHCLGVVTFSSSRAAEATR
jgi:hypothetical protein